MFLDILNFMAFEALCSCMVCSYKKTCIIIIFSCISSIDPNTFSFDTHLELRKFHKFLIMIYRKWEAATWGDDSDDGGVANTTLKPSKVLFIVYWTSLSILLKKCLFLTCLLPATTSNFVFKGSQLIAKMKYQEDMNRYGNHSQILTITLLVSAASVLFSSNTYQRLACFFDLAGIQRITKTSY